MTDTAIAIQRIAGEAVRIQFVPMGHQGTAVFMIDLAPEIYDTAGEVNRRKVLLAAKSVAENFIKAANREIHAHRT
jgi:hypothetical protein